MNVKVDAIVLAGGSAETVGRDAPYKGVVSIAGRPMVDYVLDALRAAEHIAKIAVVVPSAHGLGEWADRADKIVVSDGGVVANLLAGVDSFGYERHVLALAADVPLLTGRAIEDFLAACGGRSAGVYYPIISREVAERAYPGVRRTYLHLRGGTFTGGNLVLVDPRLLVANRDVVQRAFAARKSPVGMIRILGLSFVWKFLTRRLPLPELEAKVGEVLGGAAVAVPVSDAEIGLDIDKPEDYELAVRLLEDSR